MAFGNKNQSLLLDDETGLPIPLSQRRKSRRTKRSYRPLLIFLVFILVLGLIIRGAVAAGYLKEISKYKTEVDEAAETIEEAGQEIEKLKKELKEVKEKEKQAESNAAYYEGLAAGLKENSNDSSTDNANQEKNENDYKSTDFKSKEDDQNVTVHDALHEAEEAVPAIVDNMIEAVKYDKDMTKQVKEDTAKDLVDTAIELEKAAMDLTEQAEKMIGKKETEKLVDREVDKKIN